MWKPNVQTPGITENGFTYMLSLEGILNLDPLTIKNTSQGPQIYSLGYTSTLTY